MKNLIRIFGAAAIGLALLAAATAEPGQKLAAEAPIPLAGVGGRIDPIHRGDSQARPHAVSRIAEGERTHGRPRLQV